MESRRWWDLAFAGSTVCIAVLVLLNGWPPNPLETGAIVTLAALMVGYFLYGRYAVDDDAPAWRRLSWAIFMVVAVGVSIAFDPLASFIQAIVYPCAWMLSRSLRQAIFLNVLVGAAVGVGYYVNMGADSIVLGLTVAVMSLAFSLALGLWITRIAEYGDERARLLAELTEAQDTLAAMHRSAGVASERERLAREIHDTIAQSLTAQVMLAQRGRVENAAAKSAEVLDGTLELIETGAREALGEARALVASMAPVGVGDGTLAEALARLTARFERETGTNIELRVDPALAAARLEREHEVVLLRCSQEGLANVRNHAQASHVLVSVEVTDATVLLRVSDDGRGLAGANDDRNSVEVPPNAASGFGVSGMRDRVALVGGTLELSGRASGGTELRVSIPVSTRAFMGSAP